MRSPVYWHPFLYHIIMRLLYGKDFNSRYEALANLIPPNASVSELCMGDGFLFHKFLTLKNIKYIGLDFNKTCIKAANRKKIKVQLHNVLVDGIPPADFVIMQGSLYQFIPNEDVIIQKMLDAASVAVIIAEPIRNRADSKNIFVSSLAKYAVNPGSGHITKRFNEKTLLECFRRHKEFREEQIVDSGKELVGVFLK